MPTDLLITTFILGIVSLVCLVWMLLNLLSMTKESGLSGEFETRMAQTKIILLKPAVVFFVAGGLCSLYLAFRGGWVES